MSVLLVLVAFAIGGFVGMVLTCVLVAADYDEPEDKWSFYAGYQQGFEDAERRIKGEENDNIV